MALFVYITDSCREDARTHALSDEIERLKERIESTQSTSHFNPFPPPYLVKKKMGGRQGRLIADLRKHGDHAVVVFLAIMIRGDKAYENQFAVNPVAYGLQHFQHLVTAEQLGVYIDERTRREPPPAKPDVSEREYGFLYESFAHRQTAAEEDMVYETIEWKEAVGEPRIANQLVRFAQPCLNALAKEPGIHHLGIEGKSGWGIWVHRSEGRLLLITPVTDETVESAGRVVEQYRCQVEGGSLAHILRASRRAYPAYMLADEDTWVEIEKEPVANMALSPEESEVLLSARAAEGAFPLFINGRAGSGKSTILQYLFADLLYYYLSNPGSQVMAPPVYLTANGELLRVARSFVERILRNESAFRAHGGNDLLTNSKDILDEAFREFQPHLLSMVDATTRHQRFAPSKRVDYSMFRKLWREWFGQDREAIRDFGPDISWHVIRTYIKGMNSEVLMEPDDYMQLPENQITVTKSTFEKVFERVWEGRYSKIAEAQGLWDDQDLARHVLEHNLACPTHPAVLCDEAQDFTRIELELLLRLNLFSNRSIQPHDLSRVPFVFAGDQFQTLNPTGFRWDSIKAAFVEKFIQALDPAGRSGRAELNYRELRYNYRSTPPIVRFSNGIQALRAALFQMPEMRPQTPWTKSSRAFPVVWFQADDAAFWQRFKEADTFVVIVPCNEGEEADFVRQDPHLSKHIRLEDGIPQNVLSAARAKGREYPVVVVYGFGSDMPKALMDPLEKADAYTELNRDQSLPNEYFINRLYVAASRPKQRLIVVDSQTGLKVLWDFARSDEAARVVLDRANHGRTVWSVDSEDESSPVVEGMAMGKAEDLTRESAADPLENAKTYAEDGRARRDPFLLRQAVMAYRSAREPGKASECKALALEIEGAFLEAAQSYSDAGLVIPEMVRCLWKSGKTGWDRLVQLGNENAAVCRETEYKWARTLVSSISNAEVVIQLLQEILDRLSDAAFSNYVLREGMWREGAKLLLQSIQKTASQPEAASISSILDSLESGGLALPDRIMAEIYFKASRLKDAVSRWEKAGETKIEDYLRSKAAIEPYPGKLLSLVKTRSYEEITREFESHQGTVLNTEQWTAVAEAYLQQQMVEPAVDAAWEAGDSALLRRGSLKALGSSHESTAIRAIGSALIVMVKQDEWESLAKFASTLEFAPDASWNDAAPREFIEKAADTLQCILVRGLARSDRFAEMPGHLQRQFGDFLRRFLRVKEGLWRGVVTVEEAGAAIERGGRFSDALAFYEAVAREPNFSEDEKNFARLRWILAKNRQLDYERSQAAASKKTSDLQRELAEAMSRMGVKRLADLPKYPALPPLTKPSHSRLVTQEIAPIIQATSSPTVSPSEVSASQIAQMTAPVSLPDRVTSKVGEFTITFSRAIRRCNIANDATMQTAFVSMVEGKVGGEKEARKLGPSEWMFDDWQLKVHASENSLRLAFEAMGVVLDLGNAGTTPS
ncbi:MAG: hypothetical protein JNN17_03015 [Verrucomicrobiaceae bacterium]|nr:hypothetical protein [Verrucomicrobiaceae bacterium]